MDDGSNSNSNNENNINSSSTTKSKTSSKNNSKKKTDSNSSNNKHTNDNNGSTDNNLQMIITTCGTSVLLDSPDARCALTDGTGRAVPCPYKLVGDLASSAAFAVSTDGRTWSHLSGHSAKQQKKPTKQLKQPKKQNSVAASAYNPLD